MNIRITRLTMTNFKCFHGENTYDLDKDIVTIRGRNGAGKTTIADAIFFCLFGKNTEGQSDLELFKTRENGKVIPNLDHSVELALTTNAITGPNEISLKRSIKEVWIKKRGSEELVFKNNSTECWVNGESYQPTDFKKYIDQLVDERIFRAITNPMYFTGLKWQDQRAFLKQMAGSIEPEYIANTDELKSLVDYFDQHDESLEDYLKHRSYKIKEIRKKIDLIPTRLEEQNKALPERLDWDTLSSSYADTECQLKDIDAKIAAINQGNGSDVKRSDLRAAIDKLRQQTNAIEDKARDTIRKETDEHNQRVSDLSMRFNEALNNQKLMEQTIEADKRIIERCEQSINDCDEELERLRLAWPTRKFEVKKGDNICPTCGQYLSPDMFANKVAYMRMRFNEALEVEKQHLRDNAAKVKKNKEDAEKELEATKQKLADDTQSLADIKESINTIFLGKAKEEKKALPTLDDFLPCNEEYQAALREKTSLEYELNNLTDSDDNREQLAKLQDEKVRCSEILSRCQQQLATRQLYDRILALIDGINEEQKDLIKQLSKLEQEEDVARQYQFRQNQLLEERINKHFSLVQWRLFETVNNGGDSFEKEACECFVDGVGYHSGLNQAARLNAGLDICEALCRFYNVSAPIIIDNAESTLNILQTTGQQIRLEVHDSNLTLV